MRMESLEPKKFNGRSHVDGRGVLRFNNHVDLTQFKRSYSIENSSENPMRGWHGHKFESKGFLCIRGKVRIGGVQVDDWKNPSSTLHVFKEDLDANSMDFVFLPAGFANAIMSLESGSIVLVFSSSTLEDSQNDDYRYAPETWLL